MGYRPDGESWRNVSLRDRTVEPDDLRAFFAYADRGLQSENPTPGFNDLLLAFKAASKWTPELWADGFSRGLLFPQDFADEPAPVFNAARKVDTQVWGFERSIWKSLAAART